MSTFKRIAVSNRGLCPRPLPEQIYRIAPLVDFLVLREKDLGEEGYEALAAQVLEVCRQEGLPCVLHTYTEAARRLGCSAIHLPLPLLKEFQGRLSDFDTIGASVHSVEEAVTAQACGATYLFAGHVFPTDCKKGVPPRGISFLNEVCEAVNIPVYALGGITAETEPFVRESKAAGACRMSDYMK